MLRLTTLFSAMAALVCLSCTESSDAGLPGCGCSHLPGYPLPAMYAAPEIDASCECAAPVPSCCEFGVADSGLVQSGSLYGSGGPYGRRHAGGYAQGSNGGYYGSPDPRSFESGFESLSNMDGFGVHHRLPFHSYRRPWAHPGIADNNINIVW